MDNILRDEVNQHTSDEVAKVLADLEAQGVDIAAVGVNIEAIKTALANSGGGIKSVQRGLASGSATVSINKINPAKSFVIINPYKMAQSNTTPAWSGDGVICEQVNETSLKFTCISTSGQFVWQVVEFA